MNIRRAVLIGILVLLCSSAAYAVVTAEGRAPEDAQITQHLTQLHTEIKTIITNQRTILERLEQIQQDMVAVKQRAYRR